MRHNAVLNTFTDAGQAKHLQIWVQNFRDKTELI